MKADAIKKLTAELKIHNMQSRNKIIYTTAVVVLVASINRYRKHCTNIVP